MRKWKARKVGRQNHLEAEISKEENWLRVTENTEGERKKLSKDLVIKTKERENH